VVPVLTIEDVLEHALVGKLKKKFIEKIKSFTTGVEMKIPEGVVDKRIIRH